MLVPLYTPEQTAQCLGIKVKTVHQLVREGKLACIQVTAKDRKFTEAQIEAFIESRNIPLPKQVDRKSLDRLPSSPKRGGERSKLSGDSFVRAQLRKEMVSWR
jgi:excisionase family DNA binding protein